MIELNNIPETPSREIKNKDELFEKLMNDALLDTWCKPQANTNI